MRLGKISILACRTTAVAIAGVEPLETGFQRLGGSWGAALGGMEQVVPSSVEAAGVPRATATNRDTSRVGQDVAARFGCDARRETWRQKNKEREGAEGGLQIGKHKRTRSINKARN